MKKYELLLRIWFGPIDLIFKEILKDVGDLKYGFFILTCLYTNVLFIGIALFLPISYFIGLFYNYKVWIYALVGFVGNLLLYEFIVNRGQSKKFLVVIILFFLLIIYFIFVYQIRLRFYFTAFFLVIIFYLTTYSEADDAEVG